jgi:hypothetical protein
MIYKVYNDKYVAAILSSTSQLAEWLNTVPKELCDTLRIERIMAREYPFELIECLLGGDRLHLFVEGDTHHDMAKLMKNHGHKVVCTFTIEKDFLGDPKNPGLDYMGILPHEHEAEENVN